MKLLSSHGCPILGTYLVIDFTSMANSGRLGRKDDDNNDDQQDKPIPTRLLNLKSVRSFHEHEVELGTRYRLQPQDVVCGNRNTRESSVHPGNARFKVLIDIRLDRYRSSPSRVEKSLVVKEIVDAVRESGGNFVRCDSGVWVDIGNIKAREKAGASIRAALKGESPTRRMSSSSSVGFGSTGSSEGSGHLFPEVGSAMSSSTAAACAAALSSGDDDPMPLEPLQVASDYPKPDGFDEFLQSSSFLSSFHAHKVTVPSSAGDYDEGNYDDDDDTYDEVEV